MYKANPGSSWGSDIAGITGRHYGTCDECGTQPNVTEPSTIWSVVLSVFLSIKGYRSSQSLMGLLGLEDRIVDGKGRSRTEGNRIQVELGYAF